MTHFLFAGNPDGTKGGANDLVGTYPYLDDQRVFVALMDGTYLRHIKPAPRIWVNSFSYEGTDLGERKHWEFRMAASLDDPALKFCSYKADAAGLGPCGVVPVGRRIERIDALDVSVFYALNDPDQQNINFV